MNTAYKITALGLSIGVAFALAACGGNAAPSVSSSEASSAAEPASSSTASSAEETPSGDASDTVYENEYFGIKLALPEGWTFGDENAMNEESVTEDALAAGSSFDMVASSADGASSALVAVEQPSDRTAGQSASDLLASQVETMVDKSSSGNYSITTEDATLTFDGSDMELPAAFVTINRDDAELHVGLVTAEKDGAFLSLIVQCPTEAGVDEVISGLKAIIA